MADYAYKIETHCHTIEVSCCSHIGGRELARLYKQSGYGAINITDHFRPDRIRPDKGSLEKQIDWFLSGYRAAKAEGDKIGLKVYFSIELGFEENWNDYLVFGVTRDMLMRAYEIFEMGPERFYGFCRQNGLLFYQAHPFRDGMTRVDPRFLDGIETANMHPRHDSRNDLAAAYASLAGLPGISGSDCHDASHVGRGGILAKYLPKDEFELRDLIKSGDFLLIE